MVVSEIWVDTGLFGGYITEAVKDWKNGLYGGTSNHYGIMLKAYNESNSAKTFGTNNNSSLVPNIIV